MEQIIKWKAEDGTEFTLMTECADYENLCKRVASIMAVLPTHPQNDGCNFSNGGGYLQLSRELVAEIRGKLLDVIATRVDHKWVDQSRDLSIHPSYVARILGDYDIRPLNRAWHRLMCIDKEFREWGQPYFADHPEEGKQIKLG